MSWEIEMGLKPFSEVKCAFYNKKEKKIVPFSACGVLHTYLKKQQNTEES